MYATIKELFRFLRIRKKLWLAPILFIMVLIATLLVLAPTATVGPLLYALF